jgi:hypothetical protein
VQEIQLHSTVIYANNHFILQENSHSNKLLHSHDKNLENVNIFVNYNKTGYNKMYDKTT